MRTFLLSSAAIVSFISHASAAKETACLAPNVVQKAIQNAVQKNLNTIKTLEEIKKELRITKGGGLYLFSSLPLHLAPSSDKILCEYVDPQEKTVVILPK